CPHLALAPYPVHSHLLRHILDAHQSQAVALEIAGHQFIGVVRELDRPRRRRLLHARSQIDRLPYGFESMRRLLPIVPTITGPVLIPPRNCKRTALSPPLVKGG